ncbi:MAG: bifunctional phosphopantothenoylcysteine decarboxylase/phosphopantothenate--cysteine ligase CoaBC, partial [Bacteroidota bacterium]
PLKSIFLSKNMLTNKKILVGITGSIAAYKTITLVRLLVKAGAEIKVVMTEAATQFASPLVLSTLAKNNAIYKLSDEDAWSNHVELGRWADLFIIAPLSCNTLSKMANGQCDNLLLAVYLSATCPVLVAPAMDEDMWHHPSTKRNLALLQNDKVTTMPVGNGELASGLFGEGRMAEPEEIIAFIKEKYFRGNELAGKKVLVTAGPTYEAIDPVRFIGNHSSGKMGYALAEIFYEKGADVTLVSGPSPLTPAYPGINLQKVTSAQEMFSVVMENAKDAAIIIMAAAVSDYTPSTVFENKLKKQTEELELKLMKTKDILHHLGAQKKPGQFIAGFALETNDEFANAQQKLLKKNADCIIMNSLRDVGAGFGADTNTITIIDHNGHQSFPNKSKKEVATDIYNYIRQQID